MGVKYDFSGWATKNDLKCSDGRTIRRDAFKECDGKVVPLVWQHMHDSPENVLGHALLENRPEGVYTYGVFNETPLGQNAKLLVEHGDVTALSIHANRLKQMGGDVLHGVIREVSLVLAGANPGAHIDNPVIEHGEESDSEAIIYTGEEISHEEGEVEMARDFIDHADDGEETIEEIFNTLSEKQKNAVYAIIGAIANGDEEDEEDEEDVSHADEDGETLEEIFDTLSDKQKDAVYAIIGSIAEDDDEDEEDEEMEQSDEDYELEDDNVMKHNVFEGEDMRQDNVLTHSDMEGIFKKAKQLGSLKDAVMDFTNDQGIELLHDDEDPHVPATYGIDYIDYLFPDYKSLNTPPEFISRKMDWVQVVMNGVHHTPFSRIKSMFANITADEARARGYVKGNLKVEEVFTLLKRTTDPQTIYKKQKLDRDDVIDITDFDVVAWIKREMRMMLDEEIARAILIGDGRSTASDDHISADHIRPVATDDDLYTIKVHTTTDAKDQIKAIIRARKNYKGSGNPVFFTTEDVLTEMLLLEDTLGHPLYKTEAELATKLRVSRIVTVEVMEGKKISGEDIIGVILNLADYNVGADRGGAVSMFDDFDIDYNQQKYLIETRCSGALTKPYSAICVTAVASSSDDSSDEGGEG